MSVHLTEVKNEEHDVSSDAGISFHSKDSPPDGGSRMNLAILTVATYCGSSVLSLWISSSVTLFPEEEKQGLGHGHCSMFHEAGQVYVPF